MGHLQRIPEGRVVYEAFEKLAEAAVSSGCVTFCVSGTSKSTKPQHSLRIAFVGQSEVFECKISCRTDCSLALIHDDIDVLLALGWKMADATFALTFHTPTDSVEEIATEVVGAICLGFSVSLGELNVFDVQPIAAFERLGDNL